MTWIFTNDEIDRVLTMDDAIAAMDVGYFELAHGRGGNRGRSDIVSPVGGGETVYALKSMDGVCTATGFASIRLNSDILSWKQVAGSTRRVKVPAAPGGRYVGLVLLFSTATGEPLAIFPDGVVQRMRVAATSGLAARHLARRDSRRVALIGSGWQAAAQAMAICRVRPIEAIRCFSPNPDNRKAFAKDMTARLGIPVEPVGGILEALQDADVVLCATSAIDPVLGMEAIRPGVHLSTIKPNEIAAQAVNACDRVAVHVRHSNPLIIRTHGVELAEDKLGTLEPSAAIDETTMPELAEMIVGRAPGRQADDETTAFLNYAGLGYQFTMVGGAAYLKARAAGLGREIPTEWLTELEHP